jgi:hypothetical protein
MEGCEMIDSLDLLQDIIIEAVADAECEVDRITITAGRPPAPIGDDCTAIYIFGDRAFDLDQTNQNACVVKGRWAMDYEIHVCYEVSAEDETDEQHATGADCLYELMDLVWCALVAAKDTGAFGDCNYVELDPLEVQPRQGGHVSALGGLTVPIAC